MTVDLSIFNVGDNLSVKDKLGRLFNIDVIGMDYPDSARRLRFSDGATVWFFLDGSKTEPSFDTFVSHIVSAAKINKDNKTMNKIDLSNDIVKGSIITLSDGSTHIHRFTGCIHNPLVTSLVGLTRTIKFEDGLSVEVRKNGQSPYENGISIVSIEPPKPVIDLSTIGIGDILVTRARLEISWENVLKVGSYTYDVLMGYISRSVKADGSWSDNGSESEFDIVEIRRASHEEKANLAKNWTIG